MLTVPRRARQALRVWRVAGEVPSVNVVDQIVLIIINPIVGYLVGIRPYVAHKVGVLPVRTAVDQRYDDISIFAFHHVPGSRQVDVREMGHVAENRVVGLGHGWRIGFEPGRPGRGARQFIPVEGFCVFDVVEDRKSGCCPPRIQRRIDLHAVDPANLFNALQAGRLVGRHGIQHWRQPAHGLHSELIHHLIDGEQARF